MKITKTILLIVCVGALIQSSIQFETNTLKKDQQVLMIGPNVGDMMSQYKLIKPFIEKPYIPQEVDSLRETKRKYADEPSMTNAQLVGPRASSNNGQLDEKPTMYSTVIDRHPTVITHPILQPYANTISHQAAKALSEKNEIENEVQKLSPGAYSIPVKIEGGSVNDPTLAGYETPNFIHKSEKQYVQNPVNASLEVNAPVYGTTTFQLSAIQNTNQVFNQFNSEVEQLFNSVSACAVKNDKLNKLNEALNKIDAEVASYQNLIKENITNLTEAKDASILLNNLFLKYQNEIGAKPDFSPADEVTLKNTLKKKLKYDLQGIRRPSSEFKDLEKVNQEDMDKIINLIKNKLG